MMSAYIPSHFARKPSGGIPLKPSVIEDIDPPLVLLTCFRPYHYAAKAMGIFPIALEADGTATFKWISLRMLYSFIFVSLFLSDSILFMPFFIHINTELSGNILTLVAELAFSAGQFAAAVAGLLLIPYMSPRLGRFWNKLQKIVEFLSIRGQSKSYDYLRLRSRWASVCYLGFVGMYCSNNWFYFSDYLESYSEDDEAGFYTLNISFNLALSAFVASHVIHSMTFVFFLGVLRQSYKGLQELFVDSVNNGQFLVYLELYEELNGLVKKISGIYGVYLLVEILCMLVGTLTEVFGLITVPGFEAFSFTGVLLYLIWLWVVCNAGENLQQTADECRRSVIKAGKYFKSPSNRDSEMLLAKLCIIPGHVTACGYFPINRKLITRVVGAIATYLIVLLQFKLNELSDKPDTVNGTTENPNINPNRP